MAETAAQIRVTVLYPVPIRLEWKDHLKALAFLYGGDFVGSGSDGVERDMVFDFPMLTAGIRNDLTRFLAPVLNGNCQVLLSKLAAQAVEAETSAVVELG